MAAQEPQQVAAISSTENEDIVSDFFEDTITFYDYSPRMPLIYKYTSTGERTRRTVSSPVKERSTYTIYEKMNDSELTKFVVDKFGRFWGGYQAKIQALGGSEECLDNIPNSDVDTSDEDEQDDFNQIRVTGGYPVDGVECLFFAQDARSLYSDFEAVKFDELIADRVDKTLRKMYPRNDDLNKPYTLVFVCQ